MSEKGTYSDPRCYACKPPVTVTVADWTAKEAEIERHFPHWSEGKKAEARASLGPKPYHVGRFDRVMNYIADTINGRIPGPELILTDDNVVRVNDVLRRARSE